MLDRVIGMRVFARVAAVGSLAGAGRALGLSQTMVTKHVDALQARLGVRLLHRSTRRLTLTEAGRAYLDACTRILADIEAAESAASAGQVEPSGRLRLNVPVAFGRRWVAPLLADFHDRHPRVSLDVGFNDRLVDLIEEGWDLAIRIGVLRDSTLVSRKLAPCRAVVCAAPSYLARRGRPRTVAELEGHDCLGYVLSERLGADHWTFGLGGVVQARIGGTLRANNGDGLVAAAVSGLGVIYQPSFLVSDDLRAGRLVALALDHPAIDVGDVHAVFRPDRHLPPKVRAMIDFLAGQFGGGEPPWDR